MPCHVGDDEIDYFDNLEAANHLKRLKLPDDFHRFSNSRLCKFCGTQTKENLISKNLYDWYLKHLVWETHKLHRTMPELINEILRLEK